MSHKNAYAPGYTGSKWEQANQDAMELQDEMKNAADLKKDDVGEEGVMSVSTPGDKDEQEAEQVASKISDGGSAKAGTAPASSQVQTKNDGDTPPVTASFKEQLVQRKGGGNSLDENVQQEMGGKMGADFSDVKVHTDSTADAMTNQVNAKAFTHGSDVYFRQGEYNPDSKSGKELLAHELTHTVQQQNGSATSIHRADPVQAELKMVSVTGKFTKIVKKDKVSGKVVWTNAYTTGQSYELVYPKAADAGTYIYTFYNDKGVAVGTIEVVKVKGKRIVIKPELATDIKAETDTLNLCKNKDALLAKKTELEKDFTMTGKVYVRQITSGLVLNKIAQETVSLNTVKDYGQLSAKLVEINAGLKTGTVGNGALYLKDWVHPNVAFIPAKPTAGALPEEVKEVIATIYGEAEEGNAEQYKYLWYVFVNRVRSPAFDPTLHGVVSATSQFHAYGGSKYKKAKASLDTGKPTGEYLTIQNIVLNNWTNSPPADSGPYYFHWQTSCDTHFNTETGTDIEKEKATARWYMKTYSSAGAVNKLDKNEGWLKKVLSKSGKKLYSMYIYPDA